MSIILRFFALEDRSIRFLSLSSPFFLLTKNEEKPREKLKCSTNQKISDRRKKKRCNPPYCFFRNRI